jgi:hypothetical protein
MRIRLRGRFRPPRRLSYLFFLISLALFAAPTTALWPFPPKRFSHNALVSAGTLGLDDGDSRVIAFGDFDGDHLCAFPFLLHITVRMQVQSNANRQLLVWTLSHWPQTNAPSPSTSGIMVCK